MQGGRRVDRSKFQIFTANDGAVGVGSMLPGEEKRCKSKFCFGNCRSRGRKCTSYGAEVAHVKNSIWELPVARGVAGVRQKFDLGATGRTARGVFCSERRGCKSKIRFENCKSHGGNAGQRFTTNDVGAVAIS